ncbi:MAG: hypothetical protein HETSPECPRED_005031 [Heterodermia speciosa]|uniref:DUF2470 domain-containing protein n=1 Tax=Heterodermia speciosa TaxID=116794 RepID=A0A8H3IKK1_9LECA|nr:MAG: hypothetical protein HETSPECPRED_005031 [Heterodermia speciosa]
MSVPSADKDAAAQARIIAHMNADHSDSLIRYLRHYHGLSSPFTPNPRLTNIALGSMTISTSLLPFSSTSYNIKLDPPLNSWAEARPRLVEMDAESCKGLGCSSVTVKRYVPPTGFMMVNFAYHAWAYPTFARRSNFLPGSLYYSILFQHIPGFARFCYTIQPYYIIFLLLVHIGEAVYLARTRMEKHTVPLFSQLWWKWFISSSLEGFPAKLRFDAVVKEETLRKERQKH